MLGGKIIMMEFIQELKHNQKINIKKGLENRINIDYVIERLEDIQKELLKNVKNTEAIKENLTSKGVFK